MTSIKGKSVILGVTGASGAMLAEVPLRRLDSGDRVEHVPQVVTETGQRFLATELGIAATGTRQFPQLVSGKLQKEAEEV